MKKVKFLLLLLSVFLLCNSSLKVNSEEYTNLVLSAPLTNEYINSDKSGEVTPPSIRAPREDTVINSIDDYVDIIVDAKAPSYYKLTNNSGNNLLTVKNQGTYNICWAFSGTSVLESNVRIKNNIYTDYSPYHINNALAYTYSNGNNNYGTKENNSGGNFEDDMRYWTSNLGPVSNFSNGVTLKTMTNTMVDSDDISVDSVFLLDQFYNTRATSAEKLAFRNELKDLIQTSGAIYIHAAAPEGSYFNSTYSSVYTTTVSSYNSNPHAMVIVGWDDNFSKYNFNPSSGSYPSIDGAWIVQNSWGTSFGEGGYYYYSYEDYMIGVFASGVSSTSEKIYDNTYQYNPTGNITYINSKYVANVYHKIEDKREAITSVGVFAYAPNTKVNIYINNNEIDLSKAKKVNDTPIDIEYAGYYTYYLDEYLEIYGNDFSVIIEYLTFDDNSQTYKFSSPVHLKSHKNLTKEQVGIMPKQSYYSNNKKTWADLYKYDYVGAIKVHTKDIGTNSTKIETFVKNQILDTTEKSIYLNTYTSNIANGSSITYKVVDSNGDDVTSKFSIYSTKVVNNYDVAILTANSTLNEGVYAVTATINGVSSTKLFMVGTGYATTLLKNNAIVGVDHSRDLNIYVQTYEVLNWTSSNTNVATVEDGIVTGISPGVANITINGKHVIKVTVKDPIMISDANSFLNIKNDLDEYYVLSNDIDFNGITYSAITTSSQPFTGIIDGNNHSIKNISYTAPLISHINGGAITNIGFENIDVKGSNYAGIVGSMTYGNIDNVYLYDSEVSGKDYVGIVGYSKNSDIKNTFNTSKVSGTNYVGGIVGYSDTSNIMTSYNTGIVSGTDYVGGINGGNYYGYISEVYNEGTITAVSGNSGGIVGSLNTGDLNNTYNTGTVTGDISGGIIGKLQNTSFIKINNNYNIGTINGTTSGGIIGYGVVTSSNVNLINNYDISDSVSVFGNINVSSIESKELSISNMKNSSSYLNFDFEDIWKMSTYPILRSIIHPTNIVLSNSSYTINVGEKILLDDTVVSDSINKIAIYNANNSNVSISGDYLVGNNAGTTTVTVKTTNNLSKTFNVTILDIIDTTEYKLEDGYIIGIDSKTSYEDILRDITAETVNLYNNDKVINDTNTIVGTGMKLKVANSSGEITYTLIVLGDVNGDGYVRMNDVMLIAKYIVESQGISSNYLKAADVTSDINIKMNDVMKLAKYLVEGGKL